MTAIIFIIFSFVAAFLVFAFNIAMYLVPVIAVFVAFTRFPHRLILLVIPATVGAVGYWLHQHDYALLLDRAAHYSDGIIVKKQALPADLLYVIPPDEDLSCSSQECAQPLLTGQVQRVVIASSDDPHFQHAVAYRAGKGGECKQAITPKYADVDYYKESTGRSVDVSLRALTLLGRCLLPASVKPVPKIAVYRDRAYPDFAQIKAYVSFRAEDAGIWHIVRRQGDGQEQLIAHFERLVLAPLDLPIRFEISPVVWTTGGGGNLRLARDRKTYGEGQDFLKEVFGYNPRADMGLRSAEAACPHIKQALASKDEKWRLAAIDAMKQYLPEAAYPALAQMALKDDSDDVVRKADFYVNRYQRLVTPSRCRPVKPSERPRSISCGADIAAAVKLQPECEDKPIPKRLENYATAKDRYRKAAALGNDRAQNQLGIMYDHGRGVPEDDAKAVFWYRQAAERGNAWGQHNLGYMYEYGLAVPKDYKRAGYWYKKAADQGNARAKYRLGHLYEHGLGVPQDYAKALRWYQQAASLGDAWAQTGLAYLYRHGLGVKKNPAEALKWYRLAAQQGNSAAQVGMGLLYQYGEGVAQDYGVALRWYKKATEQGNAWGQFNLGYMLANGLGVARDTAKAEQWYKKAAAQGNVSAQKALGADGRLD